MIKEYLENEYREDLKKVFDSEPRDNGCFIINRRCFFNDSECRQKNQALFNEDPERHFALSGIFLFHFALSVAIQNEMIINHSLDYNDQMCFYNLSGWPDVFCDDALRYIRDDFEEVFSPEEVNYILDHFGLMRKGIPNRSSEFMLSCIFATMQRVLNEMLLTWDVPNQTKAGVSTKVQVLLDRIKAVLKVGYNPNELEQHNNDVDDPSPRGSRFEIFSDVEFMDI